MFGWLLALIPHVWLASSTNTACLVGACALSRLEPELVRRHVMVAAALRALLSVHTTM
jgi:hypothetical protein